MSTITFAEIYAGLQYTDHERWSGTSVTFSIPTLSSVWSPGSYGPTDEP
ncbi:hypothetical protein [Phenylobacterium sp.]|nr:hypothetical protein [Phenylobacterium sp.]